jgi:hypothetical protein
MGKDRIIADPQGDCQTQSRHHHGFMVWKKFRPEKVAPARVARQDVPAGQAQSDI